MSEEERNILSAPNEVLAQVIHHYHHDIVLMAAEKECRRFFGSSHMARDVLQDLYLQIHLSPNQVKSGYAKSKVGYLLASVRNKVIDFKRKRNVLLQSRRARGERMPRKADIFYLCPEEEQQEYYQIIESALQEPFLSTMRYYIDGYDYLEIAELSGVKVNTVSSRVSRAREKLSAFCKKQNERFGTNYPDFERFRRYRRRPKLFPPSSASENKEQS